MGPICVDIGRPALQPGLIQTTGDCASCPLLLRSRVAGDLRTGRPHTSLLSEESRHAPLGAADDTDDTSSRHFPEMFLFAHLSGHSNVPAWRSPRTEEPGGLHSLGSRLKRLSSIVPTANWKTQNPVLLCLLSFGVPLGPSDWKELPITASGPP